jgi:hypothetical protein
LNSGLLIISIIGLCCLAIGLATHFGYLKFFFIARTIPGIYPRSSVYTLIPLGILFLSSLVSIWVGVRIAQAVFYVSIASILILLIWQPRWLKPIWLRWLEDNYGHVLELMFEEARQMGVRTWEAQVKTQADLEAWADSIAKKHGWQRLR